MKYWGNFKIAFKERFTSKAMNLMWVLSKPIAIFVSITLWTTIYNYTGEGVIGDFTLDETISYMIFIILFGALTYTGVGAVVGKDIKKGGLSSKLLWPMDYGLMRLAKTIGGRVHAAFFEVLPGILIAVFFFGFHGFNPLMTILAIVSIGMALLINFFFSINWSLLYFKTINSGSLEWLKDMLIRLFSGGFIPLNFLPVALQQFFNYLPFQFIFYVPARIFINSYALIEVVFLLLIQAVWIVFLYAVYKVSWHYAVKNFSGVGV